MKDNIILLVVSYFHLGSADVPDAALAGLGGAHNSDSQFITIHRNYGNALYNGAALKSPRINSINSECNSPTIACYTPACYPYVLGFFLKVTQNAGLNL